MNKLIVKDVRSFRGEHVARLAPLTILVGENSTGKSTMLALTRLAWDVAFGATEPDFNEEPFQLGAYDELAHYHGGQGKRASSFSLGFSDEALPSRLPDVPHDPLSVVGTFSMSASQPALSGLKYSAGDWQIHAMRKEEHTDLSLRTPTGTFEIRDDSDLPYATLNIRTLWSIVEDLMFRRRSAKGTSLSAFPAPKELQVLSRILRLTSSPQAQRSPHFHGRPIAIAPIRSRPRRTYDPLKETRSPEGDHVPMLLARLSATDQRHWETLAAGLSSFGQTAGLFDRVVVHRFARNESAPFQLRVRLTGQQKEVNLVDVGYGISQILPILVDCLVETRPRLFLMQQPEVHLHPRAQAELGTFLTRLVSEKRHRFVVETHSDHLVDRIRLEIKNGSLGAEAVAILFFERVGSHTRIHDITVDTKGNVTGQPDTYRRFFLEEELRIVS